jgi:septal ring factor EnvC (AmiA/AmiB activator)
MVNVHQFPLPGGPNRTPALPPSGGPPYDPGMEARVAVLEQIAKDTHETLSEIKENLREMRRDLATKETIAGIKGSIAGVKETVGEIKESNGNIKEAIGEAKESSRSLKEAIDEIKKDLRDMRKTQKADFLWLLGAFAAMFGIMAHGFRWF